jgi:hypothetical protein
VQITGKIVRRLPGAENPELPTGTVELSATKIVVLNKSLTPPFEVSDDIDVDVIAAASPDLKLIANFGVGVDHIDLSAARAKNIPVTNTPGVLTEDTADMVMALIIAVPRRLAEGEKQVRAGSWKGWAPTGMLGHRVNGKRLKRLTRSKLGSEPAWSPDGTYLSSVAWGDDAVRVWDGESEENKAVVLDCGAKAEEAGTQRAIDYTDFTLEELAKNGMSVEPPSEQLASELREIGETMTTEWLESAGDTGKGIVDSYNAN